MKIFSHQAAAYQELLLRSQTFFAGHWRSLPIKTRWHSLIIGPTGCGKTAMVTKLQEAGIGLLRVNVTGWMPCGAHNRAVAETVATIIDHIHSHPKTILFLDELDKLWHETPWNSYIRGELFELLDGRLPTGVKGVGDTSLEVDDEGILTPSQRTSLTQKLLASTFIVGAGTFQDFYESQAGEVQIGFHPAPMTQHIGSDPTPEIIAKRLPRELLNRFNSSLLLIPQLEPDHYKLIAAEAEKSLPSWIQPAFRQAAARRIKQAIAAKSGCRFVEEALVDALHVSQPPPPRREEDPFAYVDGADLECDW